MDERILGLSMKDRNVICEHYNYEGNCLKGKEGTFLRACQKCRSYKAKKGYAPATRKNLKKRKIEEQRDRDFNSMMKEY